MAFVLALILLWHECTVVSGFPSAFTTTLRHQPCNILPKSVCHRPTGSCRRTLASPAKYSLAGIVARTDLLEYGGKIATLEECMALLSMEQKRDDMGTIAGAAWLQQLTDREMLRLCRARQRNVYGHDWRLQGSDGNQAVVEDAWAFAKAHARWRQDLQMDDLLRECRFAEAATLTSMTGVVGLVSPRVAWLNTSADLPHCILPSPPVSPDSPVAGSGPVLWVRVPSADSDGAMESMRKLMFEVAAAFEWGNAFLGVGVSEQAKVLVEVSQADDPTVRALAGMVLEQIAKPRLKAMASQMLGSPQIASHPPPSVLPLDHYPACFSQIVWLVPPATNARGGTSQRLCRALHPAWKVIKTLANLIPLAGGETMPGSSPV